MLLVRVWHGQDIRNLNFFNTKNKTSPKRVVVKILTTLPLGDLFYFVKCYLFGVVEFACWWSNLFEFYFLVALSIVSRIQRLRDIVPMRSLRFTSTLSSNHFGIRNVSLWSSEFSEISVASLPPLVINSSTFFSMILGVIFAVFFSSFTGIFNAPLICLLYVKNL